jgi:hypothetical protein
LTVAVLLLCGCATVRSPAGVHWLNYPQVVGATVVNDMEANRSVEVGIEIDDGLLLGVEVRWGPPSPEPPQDVTHTRPEAPVAPPNCAKAGKKEEF